MQFVSICTCTDKKVTIHFCMQYMTVSSCHFLQVICIWLQVSKSDEITRQLRGELAGIKDEHSRSTHDVSYTKNTGPSCSKHG